MKIGLLMFSFKYCDDYMYFVLLCNYNLVQV